MSRTAICILGCFVGWYSGQSEAYPLQMALKELQVRYANKR